MDKVFGGRFFFSLLSLPSYLSFGYCKGSILGTINPIDRPSRIPLHFTMSTIVRGPVRRMYYTTIQTPYSAASDVCRIRGSAQSPTGVGSALVLDS